jgi:predicted HicB family RNase H-like nuclease
MSAANQARVDHYRYAVQWSRDDEEFVATIAEFPSLSWLASDQLDALRGLEELVQSVIDDMRASGETVPEPFAERSYSGRLNLRVSERLHRKLAVEAVQHNQSLNSYVSQLLSGKESA